MVHILQTQLVMIHLAMMMMMMTMEVFMEAASLHHFLVMHHQAHMPVFVEPTAHTPPRPPPTSTPIAGRGGRELTTDIPKIDHEEILAQIEANRVQVAKEVDDATKELARSIQSISRIEEEEKEHVEEWNGLNAAIRERIWNNLEALMDQHEYMVAIYDTLIDQHNAQEPDQQDPNIRDKLKRIADEIEEVAIRREELAIPKKDMLLLSN